MRLCPRARRARTGKCEGPGCDHYSGTRRRLCNCCLYRLGAGTHERYVLSLKYASHDRFACLEADMVARLVALGPAPERAA